MQFVHLPNDSAETGKYIAHEVIAGAAPGSADALVEIGAAQPHNTVGCKLNQLDFQSMPTSLVAVTAVKAAIDRLYICNNNNFEVTVLIESGDAVVLFSPLVKLQPGQMINMDLGGIPMNGGIKWQASSVGVSGSLKYYTVT